MGGGGILPGFWMPSREHKITRFWVSCFRSWYVAVAGNVFHRQRRANVPRNGQAEYTHLSLNKFCLVWYHPVGAGGGWWW